eukprot:CAMPEP_0197689436 /NCGR_PEP_ID=MMETSP1338-20131121/106837_1 /TAXON_ID=43686 ORGANISM="Pelagodinium beii, Strain RCC1491" /NCGR_SAMPLE_ID=MMETSP1338 /ASSEMBLY_ACC=CAM_ASM_000754 /LENGTH=218 /DNA_ID=CAMNT_0043271769 /DNA_START=26 /DNA_END=679 /DNA_ORIENTATION=+
MEANTKKTEYEWDEERKALLRQQEDLKSQLERHFQQLDGSDRQLKSALEREEDFKMKSEASAKKMEEMKIAMADQELEMTRKLERVEQYVKEKQAAALHSEKKFQDAERMSEHWQIETKKSQADKDKLVTLLREAEGRNEAQDLVMKQTAEKHRQEVAGLQEILRRTENETREANKELLLQREKEYQNKVAMEKEREKEREAQDSKRKLQEDGIPWFW